MPQWLLVFFLPITITVYILALATDHWVAEIFVSSIKFNHCRMCVACLYMQYLNYISFYMLHILSFVYLSMFYIQLYVNNNPLILWKHLNSSLCVTQQSYGVTCFSITCCGAVVFLLGQNLVLIGRGDCKNQPQFTGSIVGFVGNGLIVIFLVSLLLIP